MPSTHIFASNIFFNGGFSFKWEKDKFEGTDLRA